MHPDLPSLRAGEAYVARLAVPPEQHPRVDPVRGIESVGLGAQSALHETQAYVESPPCSLVRSHPDAPLSVGQPSGVPGKRRDETVNHVYGSHPGQGTVAAVRAIVQRVSEAAVEVGGEEIATIGPGLLVLLGVANTDTEEEADRTTGKLLALRIFGDEEGRMNRSVTDVGGEILCVSQFTLYGDTRRGNRPSFVDAAPPAQAEPLYERVRQALGARGGRFGAVMRVRLVNDGPVTVLVEV